MELSIPNLKKIILYLRRELPEPEKTRIFYISLKKLSRILG